MNEKIIRIIAAFVGVFFIYLSVSIPKHLPGNLDFYNLKIFIPTLTTLISGIWLVHYIFPLIEDKKS